MKTKLLFAILLMSQIATAQIQIYFPTTRIVLQRSNQNQATVTVNGKYTGIADSIQARMVPRQVGQGVLVNWQSIARSTNSSVFCGAINATGGWYNLELRSWRNGAVVFTNTLERVGIGEVFMIFGHSNAQGNGYPDAPGAADDRVSCVDFNNPVSQMQLYDIAPDTANLPLTFAQLSSTSGMAPFSQKPWLWGVLGDSLVKKLNVPVLFFSAAFGGSAMYHTYKAAVNQPFMHPFVRYSQRMPYINIKNVLKKYTPIVGLRAILSAHGINDRYLASNSKDTIKFHHQTVVDKSRQDAENANLAWMVAIAAYDNGVVPFINDAQLEFTTGNPNVFRGPNLNLILNTGRVDNLHYNVAGQIQAAQLWNRSIDATFLSNSTPILPKIIPTKTTLPFQPIISATPLCVASNSTLSASNCTGVVNWSNGQTTASINVSVAGTYKANCVVQACASTSNSITIVQGVGCPTTPVVTTPTTPLVSSGCIVNKVRLKFRADCCSERLIGATIQGSNNGTAWTTIQAISVGGTGAWQDIAISNSTGYQQVRFVAGPSGYGELLELEFYNNTTKLTGTAFGSTGNSASADDALKALDGNEGTFWHGSVSSPGASNFAGLILTGCSSVVTTTPTTPVVTTPTTPVVTTPTTPVVTTPTTPVVTTPTTPVVTTPTTPVVTTPTTPVVTTPTTPVVTIPTTPIISGCTVNKVRLKFRADCCSERLVGAKIQGSNDGTAWTAIHTISVGGTGAWQDIAISNTTGYQQVRFVAGPSGYGELLELEFYNNTTKLTGTAFGSTGNSGSTDDALKALDGNEGTFWHGSVSSPGASNFAGLILTGCSVVTTTPTTPVVTTPTTPVVTTPTPVASACTVNKVRLKFRADCCSNRLIGATIQGSNNGTVWTTIHTIAVGGTGAWQDIAISNSTAYQQVRFVAGSSGYGELMELEFYNNTTKLTGTAFGSTGNSGSADDGLKALDGNEGTFWHGSVSTPGAANYAGLILTGCSASNIRLGVSQNQDEESIIKVEKLELSPNPTFGELQYTLTITEQSDINITILDMVGRLVLNERATQQGTAIRGKVDVRHLEAGAYLFQIQTDQKIFTKKIIVLK